MPSKKLKNTLPNIKPFILLIVKKTLTIQGMKEPDKIGPELSKINKEIPFRVPDGYFENFSFRLTNKIHAESDVPNRQKFVLFLKPYLVAAVLLIVAILSGIYFFGHQQSKYSKKQFYSEVSRAVEQELYSINEEIILEVMSSETPDKLSDPDVNTEELIDYLLNEDVNEDELLNSL